MKLPKRLSKQTKRLRTGAAKLTASLSRTLAVPDAAPKSAPPAPKPAPPAQPAAEKPKAKPAAPAKPKAEAAKSEAPKAAKPDGRDLSWVPEGIDITDPDSECARLKRTVDRMIAAGEPIKVQVGFGRHAKAGFLNVDISVYRESRQFWRDNPDNIFVFPFIERTWPIPNDCVDYVFHEDFIEHVPQKLQIMFLAEMLRVMKPGAWHRVNTPCLVASIKRHCDFSQGSAGIYHREWDRWGHQALYTRYHLEEVAKAIGYREVVFNQKNQSVSQYRVPEIRPGNDRDPHYGNVHADLLK